MPPSSVEVLAELKAKGYVHIRERLSLEDFEAVCSGLGTVAHRGPLRPSPGIFHYHAENPALDLLAWYCVEEDREDGSCLLLDLAGLEEEFTPDELAVLSTLRVGFSMQLAGGPTEPTFDAPMLGRDAAGWRCCYSPYSLLSADTPGQALAIARWEGWIAELALAPIRVRLKPGQALVFDDRRMLHGRDAIASDSPRRFERLFLVDHALRGGPDPRQEWRISPLHETRWNDPGVFETTREPTALAAHRVISEAPVRVGGD